jgi:hypothetical protein
MFPGDCPKAWISPTATFTFADPSDASVTSNGIGVALTPAFLTVRDNVKVHPLAVREMPGARGVIDLMYRMICATVDASTSSPRFGSRGKFIFD